tara:strand:- start:1332 stop:1586 length:255 start_codon:yes stop_codon:yes gene_type:complete
MDKKLTKVLSALQELPDLSELGNLKIYHMIILKLIEKEDCIPVKDIISNPQLSQISQAQRYRYIDNLINRNLIKYHSKSILHLA